MRKTSLDGTVPHNAHLLDRPAMDTTMAAQLAELATSQINQQQEQYDPAGSNGNKRKSDDGQQGQSKARRSRYISLAW